LDILRSLMFTPGQRQNMIEKALALGEESPDAIMFDFEDSVPPDQKDLARELVGAALGRSFPANAPSFIVRVNSVATGRQSADMRAVISPNLFAILLPKVDRPEDVVAADAVLSLLEQEAGLPAGKIGLIAAIESARAIHCVVDIALSTSRLKGLMFGAEDYARDLGLPVARTGPGWDLLFARSAIINAAAMASLFTMDQVHMNFKDQDAERSDAIASRQLGFSGKCAIHPSQIPILNSLFSPTADEVEHARKVVAAFQEAAAAGIGCVMLGGQVVEQPILERAQRIIQTQKAIERRTAGS
jgi:citrate lyase subunit beta/citryl-CoA lyase